jgi:hypothetical protein
MLRDKSVSPASSRIGVNSKAACEIALTGIAPLVNDWDPMVNFVAQNIWKVPWVFHKARLACPS